MLCSLKFQCSSTVSIGQKGIKMYMKMKNSKLFLGANMQYSSQLTGNIYKNIYWWYSTKHIKRSLTLHWKYLFTVFSLQNLQHPCFSVSNAWSKPSYLLWICFLPGHEVPAFEFFRRLVTIDLVNPITSSLFSITGVMTWIRQAATVAILTQLRNRGQYHFFPTIFGLYRAINWSSTSTPPIPLL